MVDVNDQEYQALQARLNEARRMVTVVRDSNDAITIQDFEGHILAWNHGAEQMFGYGEQEALKKNIWELTPPDKAAEQKDFNRRLLAGEAVTSLETQRLTKDGRLLDVWLTVTKLVDEAGKVIGIASTERDITERKNAETEIRRLNAELGQKIAERTAKLERSNQDLQQFAYVASHDLQEPLRMVASFTQLLAKRYQNKLDQDADDFIKYIVEGATRMQAMINDLLNYSRIGTRGEDLVATPAGVALKQALTNIQLLVMENQAVIEQGPLPVVLADPTQLPVVFQNLITNAIKYRRPDVPPRIEVRAERREKVWEFTVRDNGQGIDPRYFERVFIIFQRIHGRTDNSGSSIGLPICKRIIERQGGRIWIESEMGQGTVIHFTVPGAEEEGKR
jgi:PAS domain S-box-containing protein